MSDVYAEQDPAKDAGEDLPTGAETLIGNDIIEDTPQPHSEVVEDARGDAVGKIRDAPEPASYVLDDDVKEAIALYVAAVKALGKPEKQPSESREYIVTALVNGERKLVSEESFTLGEARKHSEACKAEPDAGLLFIVVEALDDENRKLYGF